MEKMKITSTEFSYNDKIPVEYTCDGKDVSPSLMVSDIPSGAKSLALIVDDPDAPSKTWVHWVAFNIPISSSSMEIKEETQKVEGTNDFGKMGYNGPCPPSGIHHYYFKVYALDSELAISEGSIKEEVESEMKGKILAQSELVGIYQK